MASSEKIDEIILNPDAEKIYAELVRGCEEVLPEVAFRKKFHESYTKKKPLKVKAGFDPTAPDLHLGHTVLLQKLAVFQKYGHEVIFLIGDYTALIGDPTGKSETRKPLTQEEVLKNAETYKTQVFKVLEEKKTRIVFNSQWLNPLSLKDILGLTSRYTVARMLERDDFQKRYSAGSAISLVEFLYPLMQGYDSVALQSDIELGGTDQKFNLLVGRDLQVSYGQEPQVIMTLPLLVGLDGVKKMSKSLGNYVSIQEIAMEIYGKVMSISDELMWEYYRLLSEKTLLEISTLKQSIQDGSRHPKEIKSDLALELASRYQGKEQGLEAKAEWEKIHTPAQRGLPSDMPVISIKANEDKSLINAMKLGGLANSNSEARRQIESGALYIIESDLSETVIRDYKYILSNPETVLRSGKRKFMKVILG